jgi:hypothetical protein
MRNKLHLKLMAALFSTGVTILGMELALSVFDPWGMHYFDDVGSIWEHVIPHENRVYVLSPGVYHFSNWSVNQLNDYTRLVNNSQEGACKVVFLGDSVTWGHGVNDDDTWVNLLAAQLPGTTVINAGFDAYNSENVLGTLADYPDAHLFVYLIFANDAVPTLDVHRKPHYSMLGKYLLYIVEQLSGDADQSQHSDTIRFKAEIQQMGLDPRVIFIGFDEPLAQSLKPEYDVFLIPAYRNSISKVDFHPNPEGHKEIAEAVLPYVRAAVERQCADLTVNN